MLKKDLESIKELNRPYYRNVFKIKWNELSIKEKQDLMMSYIDTIEVIKTDKDIKIKNINFRKTFIEEYANLFNNGGTNRYQEIEVNGEIRQVEISKPMTRTEVINYIKKLQIKFPAIDYQEIQKEKYNDSKFYLRYERENILNEPLKLIPILNKKGINDITHYGIIEVPVLPSTIIKI